ncbi:hypothetical protein BIW11_03195 [Tropilaelaps mercedesae]|uniref:Uncharacterized protein n=1 Tax=Tropilaelaps mercedesae TaxID=418985 RepID=A0A1V9XQK6_9ACAR|nr:hypothetical protein BIW11_03195 [Tropilaelaps mercedesae]
MPPWTCQASLQTAPRGFAHGQLQWNSSKASPTTTLIARRGKKASYLYSENHFFEALQGSENRIDIIQRFQA